MRNTRDDKKRRLHKARRDFEDSGNRFFGPSFAEGFDFDAPGVWGELVVLTALLRAYRGKECTSIFFNVRDPRGPVHQGSDLMVANLELGAVLVEVKAHRLKDLSWQARKQGICVRYGNEQKGVIPQVERAHTYLKNLIGAESRKLGQQMPPISYAIAFPNVSKTEFLAGPIAQQAWQEGLILFEETLSPARLCKKLREAAELGAQRMGRLPAKMSAIELVDSVMGGLPNGLRRPTRGRPAGCVGEEIDRIQDSNCLRPDQRKITERPLAGRPTLLRGVAGSGKSIILAKSLVRMVELYQAERAADTEPLRVLTTCFNRTLVPLLKRDTLTFAGQRRLDLGVADVSFLHFEGVLAKLRNEWNLPIRSFKKDDGEDEHEMRCSEALALVNELFAAEPELEESLLYDFVFVDEAQDLYPEAFRLLQRLVKRDEKSGERGIAIFYDDAQNLYGRKRPVWKDLGINLAGGRRTVAMTECRRTTRPIATFAFNVLLGAALPDGERALTREFSNVASLERSELIFETDEGLVVEFAQRPGLAPEVWRLDDQEAEVEAIVTTVMDLINSERVAPEEILIQTDRQLKTLNRIVEAFENIEGAPGCHVAPSSKDELIVKEGCVTLSTIYSAKGYDAPIVFIMNAQGFGQDPQSRARFYVGATRAQLLLYVSGHGQEDEGLLSEMEEVLRRLPKIGGGWV